MFTLPDPQLNYAALFRGLLPVAFVLLVGGFLSAVVAAQESPRQLLLTIVKFALIVALIAKFDALVDLAQNYVENLVTHQLKAEPDKTADKYLALLAQRRGSDAEASFWDRITGPATTLVEGLLAAIMLLFSIIAGWVMALAYLVQKLVLQFSYGLSPLFLALLGIGSVRSIGVHYLQSVAGVVLWPLSWAVCSQVTANLLNYVVDQSFLPSQGLADDLSWSVRTLLGTMLIGLWIIFSTIVGPWAMQRAITTGTQIGSGLLAAAGGTGSAGGASLLRHLRQRP